MTVLRQRIRKNVLAVRLAVLVLATWSLLPVQLVWCHEDGQAPRMEMAINGQCLPGSQQNCCSGDPHPEGTESQDAAVLTGLSQDCGHDHCIGCSDKLVHSLVTAQHNRVLTELSPELTSGYLYSLQLSESAFFSPGCQSGLPEDRYQQPALGVQIARSTCLLL